MLPKRLIISRGSLCSLQFFTNEVNSEELTAVLKLYLLLIISVNLKFVNLLRGKGCSLRIEKFLMLRNVKIKKTKKYRFFYSFFRGWGRGVRRTMLL